MALDNMKNPGQTAFGCRVNLSAIRLHDGMAGETGFLAL